MRSRVVHLQLLGDFRLTCDDTPVEGISTPRLQSLVAYLALHRDAPQLRQRLAFLFWPDSSEAQARNNLRQFVHALRHTAPDISGILQIDTHTLQWRRDVDLRLDVEEFERALGVVEDQTLAQDAGAVHAAGERMLALYQADLLPGCYDEWITPERERLRERFTQALGWLIAFYEARRDFAMAIRCARQHIRCDPLNEEGYRCLMRLHALTDDRVGELRAFQACATALRQALGMEPSQATEELHQRLLHLESTPTASGDHLTAEAAHMRHQPLALPPSLVGRQREWEMLHQAWEAACADAPGFALITGEAGMGKSRLAEEMAQWARERGATTATARSYAAEGQLSFAPVIEWLRSPGLRPHVRKLETVWLTELARLLPELLVENPDLPHYEPLTEYGQRQRFFQALTLAVLAAPQPLLLVMDDLQWCDQETLEWLHFLQRFDARARLLILGMARSEETPPLHPLHALLLHLRPAVSVTEIALRPLDAAETAQMAAHMIDRQLDVRAALRLFDETEGNPLFIIETVRAGLDKLLERLPRLEPEAPLQTPTTSSLPPGLRAMIASRLTRLSPPARELAGLAATVGRAFSLDILAHVNHSDEDGIVSALDELWQRRIVRDHGADTYDFTHDKLRE
ncbi:MAG TPA: AAA family ATPase, partial [Ktedonobacterales bacterium]|nr:AAA family ATPase [Ktedonobacterales bacterium]